MDRVTVQAPWGSIEVLLADRFSTRLIGLLGRPGLSVREGMLMTPCRSIHTLGMRFPIDVLFLDEAGAILEQRIGVRPWRTCLAPPATAMVLELAAGVTEEWSLAGRNWPELVATVRERVRYG